MGLLKTAGKVAVASAVHGRIQRKQQRWAAQDLAAAQAQGYPGPAAPAAPAPPPPPPSPPPPPPPPPSPR